MRKIYLMCLGILLLGCMATTVFAQKAVTGTVRGAEGEPLPAVSIQVKNTQKSTSTNAEGKFSISVNEGNILVFTYIGYKRKEVTVGVSTNLTVVLESSTSNLEEVQVTTALGVKKEKRSLGYATQTVSGKDLTIGQAPTIAQGLMGKVAGLQISQAGGGADGGSSRVVVRGNTTFTGDNRALIIVDGVAINNDPLNVNRSAGGSSVLGAPGADVSGYNDWGTGMNMVNQEDIENITVLKGPAAAALYGARGANGVILITRKKGGVRSGLGIDYNFSTRNTNAFSILDFQNEYGQGGVGSMTSADQSKWFTLNSAGQRMQVGNGTNSGTNYTNNSHGPMPYANAADFYTYFSYPGSYSWGARFDNKPIMFYDGVQRPYQGQPDNWKAYFPDGSVTSHNIAINGGNDNASARFSYTRDDTKPNMINSNMQNNNFNLGSLLKISKKVSAEVTSSFTNFKRHNAPQQGAGWQAAPVYSMARDYDPAFVFSRQFGANGERLNFNAVPSVPNAPAYPWSTGYLNNQYWALLKNNADYTRNQFVGSIKLTADVTDWLNATALGGVDNSNDVLEVRNTPVDVLGQSEGQYREALSKYLSRNLNAFVRLHKDNLFGKEINGSFTAGGESYFRNDYTVSNETSGSFVRPFIYALNNGVNNPSPADEVRYAKKINSVYSFLNLSYKNQLFFEATARNDWSSTLPDPYFYPSANLAYVFTDGIKGMQQSMPWLNFGKLKLSYAETGSDADPYAIHNLLESVVYNGQEAQSLPSILKKDGIKPARSKSFELGLNLGFLKNRLNVDITAYSMKSFNQILNNPLPVSSGYSGITINTGSLGNKGIEFIISGTPIKNKDFSWDVSLSGASSTTKVLSLSNGINELNLGSYFGGAGVSQRVKVGENYGTLYGRDFTYLNGQKVVKRAANTLEGTSAGPVTFTAGGKTYYAGTQWVLTPDEVPIGNSQPFMTGGITNTFRYKNLSLYLLADAKIGGDTYFGSYAAAMGSGTIKETLKERNGGGLPYVYPDGTTANVGVNFGGVFADGTPNTDVVHYLWYYAGTYSAWNHLGRPTSASVFENSWMKLREVALTYQVPQQLIKKTKFLQNLSVSLVGRDLFYIFTTIPKGLNPEGINGIGNVQGIEYSSMPRVRSFGFTVKTSL